MNWIVAPGIYIDVPTADYFSDPCVAPSLTQSIAKVLLARSPAHAFRAHPRLGPSADEDEDREKYDASKAIGNAAHALLIGRGKEIAEGEFAAWTTKEAKAFRADAEAAGRSVILSKHMLRAQAMVAAARRQMDDAGWQEAFRVGHGEVVIAWQEDGIWLRSMIDWMTSPTRLYDLKSTGLSVAPHTLGIRGVDAGWDVQAAMQERGLDILDPAGAGRRKFRFAPIENEPPYAMVPVELPESWLVMGRKKLAVAIDLWRECMRSGTWPAYASQTVRPEYPGFLETRWLEREVSEFADRPGRAPFNPDIMMAG